MYSIICFFSPGYVLDSCDGHVVSNNNINVDFGVIKYQCSCYFNFASNATLYYSLSQNPGFDKCGTAIQIKEMGENKFRIPCASSTPFTVPSSQFTTAELICDHWPFVSYCTSTDYCLRVLSNSRYCLLRKYYLK